MIRLYLNTPLSEKIIITLPTEQSHYLCHVLRKRVEDTIVVFNEQNGDWLAKIVELTKKQVLIQLNHQTKVFKASHPMWLAFAPLKQEATNLVLEKSTELGVTHIQPLWMEHSNSQRLNQDRWRKIVIEASEQCERHDIPIILPSLKLTDFLNNLPSSVQWFAGLERSNETCILKALQTSTSKVWGFIIGPEGGFSATEKQILTKHPSIEVISLSNRVLRAETAALTALAIAQGTLEN